MATTQNTYTGNGSTTDYSITFEYLKDADVKVTLDHVATTAFTLPNATTLRFTTAPGNNVAIRIFRDTDVDAARFVYSAGSAIKAAELNENADQALYGLQETANTDDITDEAVTTAKIRDGAVTTAKFANLSITTAQLTDSSVTTAKIADDAVTTAKILDDNVTAAKLATDSVTADAIAAGAVDTSELAPNAVTTVKINDDAVTTAKIASGAVTSDSIANGTIQTEDIADANITTAKLDNDSVTAAKLADNAVVTDNIVDANVTTAKIADSAITNAKLADAELVELATMGGNTASALADLTQAEVQILDGATVTTAELNILDGVTATATELNQLDGNTLKTTGTDFTSSSQFPAASEIDARITARIDPLGGFEAIADEDSFPATAPPAGTVISIANANNLAVNSSGVGAGTRAGGSDAVVINGFPSTFNSTSLDDGIGLLVIATSTAHTYDFHRVVAKNEDVRQLSSDINDFKARYRIGSSNPTTDNDAGDLFFNTGTSKMLVYNATSSAWEEVQAVGDFFINTLSSSSGTGGGSATFNGTAYRFTLSNAPTYAQQLLVSINGVVQKPNSGTSQPSEGFAIDGGDIILAAAPATGSNAFFITIGSSVGIGTPSDNTISTAKIIDGAVTNAKVSSSAAIAGTKISPDFGSQNVVTTGSAGVGTTSPRNISGFGSLAVDGTSGSFVDLFRNGTREGTAAVDSGGFKLEAVGSSTPLIGITNGTERMRIDNTGNVGVGITPTAKFHVGGTIQSQTGSTVAQMFTDGGAAYFTSVGAYPMLFQTNGSERMRINSSGNVGIGTTSPGSFEADANQLVIGSGSGNQGVTIYSGNTNQGIIYFADGTSGAQKYTGFISYDHNTNAMRFGTNDGNERMRIDSSGNLGLGTNTPTVGNAGAKLLHIHNTASTGTRPSEIVFTNGSTGQTSGSGGTITFYQDNLYTWNYENQNLIFGTNATERMRVDTEGRLQIGTTAGTGNLNVAGGGDAALDLIADIDNNGSNQWPLINFRRNSATGTPAARIYHVETNGALIFDNGGSERLRIQSAGGISFNGDTAAANALDDYEEGSWTPTALQGATGFTVDTGNCVYVKVGKMVTLTFEIYYPSGLSGSLFKIGGIPFAVDEETIGTVLLNDADFPANRTSVNLYGHSNELRLYASGSGQSWGGFGGNDLTTDASIIGSLTYRST